MINYIIYIKKCFTYSIDQIEWLDAISYDENKGLFKPYSLNGHSIDKFLPQKYQSK